jgi:hypothetical protein
LGTDAVSIGSSNKTIIHQNYLPKQISFMLNFKCPILHPTVMMRKSVFENGYHYEEQYRYAEDFALWRKVDNGNNIAILPIILLSYRTHENQTNADRERLNIQIESVIKALEIFNNKSVFNAINSLVLNQKKNSEIFVNKWFKIQITNTYRLFFFTRFYIKMVKRKYMVNSQLIKNIVDES